MISFKKDGSIILDGNKIQVSQVNQTDMNLMPIYKSKKSLKPYGSLKSSDYDDYLTSGKQNIALGKSLNNLTITALAVVISGFHPYVGIAVSLSGVALRVHDVLMNVNPTTEYLGCKYTTYTAGYSDYKYINKFYANRECTGTYKLEKSYEHFIVY